MCPMFDWWYVPRALLKFACDDQAKSVPAFAVLGTLPNPATIEASPNDPSPRRLSAEFGWGFPPRGHGVFCVTGSSMFATRVCSRPVSIELNHTIISGHHATHPSPTNTKSRSEEHTSELQSRL